MKYFSTAINLPYVPYLDIRFNLVSPICCAGEMTHRDEGSVNGLWVVSGAGFYHATRTDGPHFEVIPPLINVQSGNLMNFTFSIIVTFTLQLSVAEKEETNLPE